MNENPSTNGHNAEPSPTSTGEKAKARDILTSIRLLKQLERDQRPPTPVERHDLSLFGGFGAVARSIFPDVIKLRDNPDHEFGGYPDAGWQAIGDELKSLLTPEEYDSAKRTTFSQFFTSPVVMSSMHEALSRLGVPDDGLVLEPGCGVGNFMSQAPSGQRFIGVELDSISGRIARVLHPEADIRIENFRDTKLPQLDAVIGNVPFADIKLDLNGEKLSLHDFFVAKSVEALKPGGVLAVVTSHYTLDKQNAAVRERLADKADFLGAIRLPADAFKREGTSVTTDVLFLRKRAPGQEPNHADPEWMETSQIGIEGADLAVNRYFLNHHEMVLGDWSRQDTLYGTGFSVKSNGDLASQLKEAIARLPGQVVQTEAERANPPPVSQNEEVYGKSHIAPKTPAFQPPPPLRHITEGSLFVGDDKIIREIKNGQPQPIDYHGQQRADGAMTGRRIAALIGLRDLSRRVLQSQNEGWPEANRTEARRALNAAYDRFVVQHGPVNKTTFSGKEGETQTRRMPNLVKFKEDPDAMLVMALEEYDEATGTAKKAPILIRDVVGPKPPVTHVASAEEGLLVSLNDRGEVDIGYIAGLYNKPGAIVISELGDLIYNDPETREWQTADAYLSGNVRAKLVTAEKAGPEYVRNAVALRSVQPEDVLPGDIDANLGAPWIPASDIQAFAAELFNVPAESFKIGHLKKDAVWSVEPDYKAIQSVAASADYGTGRINGTELLSLAMNLKSPVIYDIVRGANGDERVLNPTETAAAKEKQKAIKEKFKGWIFSDPDRTERLVRDYNDTYNNLRPRLFDGSHLDFPGMSKAIELRPHQKDAIWRAMTGGNTLLAHAVGAGKTNVCVAAAMKMKQAGLIKKALVTCPNHMLEQFSREWLQLYPNAKILVASKEDFTKDKRKSLTAKIATGDWDGIIVTHSSFERIGMSVEYQKEFLRDQIKEYEDLLLDKAATGRNIIKTIEKQKARREERLKDLLAEEKKDSGLVFDELGVDQIFVDECFTYDTLIETDHGQLKIGDIVTKMLHVNVKSVNQLTQAVQWKPVIRWFANKRRNQLVEVVHEEGSVRCTAHHKLFTGIVTYRKAGEIEAGETLLVLQKTIPSHEPVLSQDMAEVLLGSVPGQGQDAHSEMRVVQDPVLLPHAWPGQPFKASSPLLHCKLQDEGAASKSGYRCDLAEIHAEVVGQSVLDGQKELWGGGTNEDKKSDEFSGVAREGVAHLEGDWASPEDSRRQWKAANRASVAPGKSNRNDHGVADPHQANKAPDGGPPEALHGRSCGLASDAGRRGGWPLPQRVKDSSSRREEGQGLIASRVVSVTVLEPDGDGEYRFGGRDHSVVYDIEVADNHNYFANGVLVSNCHAFKNLETPTKMERVAGIQTGGSERAFDLLMKAKYLDSQHPGHGLIGASGTPISNSMVEMFTNQRFFDPAGLEDRGIEHFDAWAASFGEVVDTMEISPDGASLRPRSRFAKFVNLPELVQMFRAFADVQTADMLDLPRPALEGGKPQTVACPMSEEQKELQGKLIERYDRIRSSKVDPREDNALAITTDGRKLALDGRMLQPGSDHPDSKINALTRNVARIWEKTTETRGTQMIFCDMGVNPTPWGFSAYDEVANKLEEKGIPRHQIAIMGDADTDAKKQALFEKVRQGTVRVLIGSTAKMGTGTNVQKRLVALHHLDAPWKPAEVEQRDGRILRQGNMNEEVSIFRYVTEGSFDAFMWQALETKARFIAQVMSGDCAVRKAEDIGGQELSYAEVKAIASGNPAVLTLAETDAELQRLAILRKNHHDEQYLARRNLRDLPDSIRHLTKRVDGLTADMATMEGNAGTLTTERIGDRMKRMPEKVDKAYNTRLGNYHGLEAGIILHPLGGTEVYLDGAVRCREQLVRDNPGPRAVLNALERLSEGYEGDIRHLKAEIALKEGQLRDYEGRIGKPFAHEGFKDELEGLRDQLKIGLSEHPPEGSTPVAELAERIKSLREANTVEAAPERTGTRKTTRAEVPVTARIRARGVEQPAGVQEVPEALQVKPEPVQKPEESPAAPPAAVIATPEPFRPLNGHAKTVTKRRQANEAQLRLF